MFLFGFMRNAIALAEFRHQRYIIENSRSGTGWIIMAVAMLLPGILVGLGAALLAALNVSIADWAIWENPLVNGIIGLGTAALIVMNIALYFVLMLMAVGLSYSSISREKANRTWDVLLLTNVSARDMVWGKWWASLMALWGDHFMLVLLRIGIVGIVVVNAEPVGGPVVMVVMLLGVFAFTVIDAAFTVALGIASAMSGAASSVSGSIVLAVRLIGMGILGIGFVISLYPLAQGDLTTPILAITIVCALFSVFTYLALIAAQVLAVHAGQVSPA